MQKIHDVPSGNNVTSSSRCTGLKNNNNVTYHHHDNNGNAHQAGYVMYLYGNGNNNVPQKHGKRRKEDRT